MYTFNKRTIAIFIFIIALGIFYGEQESSGKSNELKGPAVKIVQTVHDINQFESHRIHPERYILSKTKERPYSPVIYDIQNNRLIKLPPVEKLSGLPAEPLIQRGKGYRERKLKMIMENKFWKWNRKEIVYYNPESGTAGIYLEKEGTEKFITGAPPCSGSGEMSKFIDKYQRYYCYGIKKYVDTKDYLKDYSTQYYAVVDLKSGRVKSLNQLSTEGFKKDEQSGIYPIGVDPGGRYFYYSNRIFFYKAKKTTGHILLYKFDIESGKISWRYRVEVPVRYKGKTAGSYAINYFASPDLSRIVFWEYDETKSGASGWLNGPPAQAYIVDTENRSHFAINAPVTPYGHIIGWENRYLLMGSNQTGVIHRIDLQLKKEDMKVNASKSMFYMALTPGSKYLYVFTKYKIEVRSWPGLKLVKNIPLSSVFTGIDKLLVSETMITLQKGRYAVIGVLKKGKSPWAASDRDDGFHLLMLGE